MMMNNESASTRVPVIEVCHGPQCSDCGSRELSKALQNLNIDSFAGDCRSQCPNAPLVLIDNKMIVNATAQMVQDRINNARHR